MKKLITLFLLASAPVFGEFYGAVGTGPFSLIPNVSVGIREDTNGQVFDASISCSYSHQVSIISAIGNILYFPMDDDYYLGPSIAITRFDVKHYRDFWDQSVGVILGKHVDDGFIEMLLHKEFSSKDVSTKEMMLRVRVGKFF